MSPENIHQLIELGATGTARTYIKKLAIPNRMELLKSATRWVPASQRSLVFYRDNFAIEFGALSKSDWDCEKAVELYRQAKGK